MFSCNALKATFLPRPQRPWRREVWRGGLLLLMLLFTGITFAQSPAQICANWLLREQQVPLKVGDFVTVEFSHTLDATEKRPGPEASPENSFGHLMQTWRENKYIPTPAELWPSMVRYLKDNEVAFTIEAPVTPLAQVGRPIAALNPAAWLPPQTGLAGDQLRITILPAGEHYLNQMAAQYAADLGASLRVALPAQITGRQEYGRVQTYVDGQQNWYLDPLLLLDRAWPQNPLIVHESTHLQDDAKLRQGKFSWWNLDLKMRVTWLQERVFTAIGQDPWLKDNFGPEASAPEEFLRLFFHWRGERVVSGNIVHELHANLRELHTFLANGEARRERDEVSRALNNVAWVRFLAQTYQVALQELFTNTQDAAQLVPPALQFKAASNGKGMPYDAYIFQRNATRESLNVMAVLPLPPSAMAADSGQQEALGMRVLQQLNTTWQALQRFNQVLQRTAFERPMQDLVDYPAADFAQEVRAAIHELAQELQAQDATWEAR